MLHRLAYCLASNRNLILNEKKNPALKRDFLMKRKEGKNNENNSLIIVVFH